MRMQLRSILVRKVEHFQLSFRSPFQFTESKVGGALGISELHFSCHFGCVNEAIVLQIEKCKILLYLVYPPIVKLNSLLGISKASYTLTVKLTRMRKNVGEMRETRSV